MKRCPTITVLEMLTHLVQLNVVCLPTCEVLCNTEGSKHSIGFPPPVVLGLGELRLTVVAVYVWPGSVGAGPPHGSEGNTG